MQIVVDVHEPKPMERTLRALGLDVLVMSLRAGDYMIDDVAVVERKTVRDLHLSVIQGRLWRQLSLIRRRAPWRYLLIEGQSMYDGPVSSEAIRGLVIAVDELGVCVVHSRDLQDSAAWLTRIARRRLGEHRTIDRPVYAQRPKREPGVSPPEQALSAAAGISTVTARTLLGRFGSLLEVLSAPPEELQRVPGVGANRAHAIHSLAQSN
ncbi:MAG TPA: ERCC4 domain-containing protein [Gaiellaceae bacterium]|jgi:ERCC4-type nuclease|nr:ERCC4 domain-containing protein [Gaiellaceae bacterium]